MGRSSPRISPIASRILDHLPLRAHLDTAPIESWGECPHEPQQSSKFEDSSFKPGSCFKLETEIFDL